MICSEMEGIGTTGSILVAPFRPEAAAMAGSFVPVPGSPNVDELDFSVSPNGILVYAAGTAGMDPTALVWVDRAGRPGPSDVILAGYLTPAISPDGRQLAATRIVEAGREELWRYDLETGTAARLGSATAVSNLPLWFPDGERILFNSLQPRPGLYWVSRDLGDTLSLLLPRGEHILVPGSFSAGGRILAYTELNPRTLGDLWTLSIDDGSTTPLLRTQFNERTPMFSPDGGWLAFASDISGRDEVYVQAFPGPGAPVQVSDRGGREPLWSRDGKEIFYRSEYAVMAVPVQTEGPFAAGRPTRLFEDSYAWEYKGRSNYDVGSDGRFVMVKTQAASSSIRLGILVNWLGELETLGSSGTEGERDGGP
jgi:dipeptidyl aminopeptidase/acylaminoacyl peptidase